MSPRRALPPALYRRFPFLQEVLDGMPASVKVVDSQFNVVWANRTACEESGKDFPFLRGRTCHVHLNGFLENCPWCPVVKAFRDGERHVNTFRREGKGRWMEVTGYPLTIVRGDVRYAVEVTRALPDPAPDNKGSLPDVLEATEKQYLSEVLRSASGDLSKTAALAGVNGKTLQRRLRKYGLHARDYRHPD